MTEKNAINIIDGALITADNLFKEFKEVLNTAKTQIHNLEREKEKAIEDKAVLETVKNRLEAHEEQLQIEKAKLEKHHKGLEIEAEQLEKDKKERDQKIGSLNEEQHKLLEEYAKVKVELQKFAQASAKQEESEFNFEKIQALLSIYRVLIEEIWQGQSHFRILQVLHGDKEVMSRQELKNSTGVGGAFVLRSVQELARVNLLEYDENTGTAKLKKRLFPKKAIEKK